MRQAAIKKWVGILKLLADHGAVKVRPGDIELLVKETLEPKATATLEKRGCSLMLYFAWAKRRGLDPYPVVEDVVAQYLRDAVAAAATAMCLGGRREKAGGEGQAGRPGARRRQHVTSSTTPLPHPAPTPTNTNSQCK